MHFITWITPPDAQDERQSQCQICGELFPSAPQTYFLVEEKGPGELYSWGVCCPNCHGSKARAVRFVCAQVEALAENLETQRGFLRELEALEWPEDKKLN